jgi:hypothetical protein
MTAKHHGPMRPETWAVIMLGLLGFCGLAVLAVFLIGGLSLAELGVIFLLLLLAAVSVIARYLSTPGPSA